MGGGWRCEGAGKGADVRMERCRISEPHNGRVRADSTKYN